MEQTVRSLDELAQEAERLVRELTPNAEHATLVTLSGELGAGKTTFTQALAKVLGVEEHVTSPTFVLEKVYELARELGGSTPKFARLVHIDAYRLDSGADLAPLGFDEIMRDPSTLVLLEWPEKVADGLPTPSLAITIAPQRDGARIFTYMYGK